MKQNGIPRRRLLLSVQKVPEPQAEAQKMFSQQVILGTHVFPYHIS